MAKPKPSEAKSPEGSLAYENWHAYLRGEPAGDTLEYPIFSNAQLVDEVVEGLGPYQVLNAISHAGGRPYAPAAVLRVGTHGRWEVGPMDRTDYRRYHGRSLQDELAALLSLELGIRCKAGGASRWFQPGGDPMGRPWSFLVQGDEDPILTFDRPPYGLVIPQLVGERYLSAIPLLLRFPEFTPEQSIAVVRAARLYQDAVWVADREPELSWLLLVSAAEVAAVYWRSAKEGPLDRLIASHPDIVELIKTSGSPDLLQTLAELLAPYLGVTRKFLDFMEDHLPPPPPQRPEPPWMLSWEPQDLRRSLRLVYDYRSRALHEGTPFPGPLCRPPGHRGVPQERPAGLASGSRGGVWLAKDLPMMLHVFAYLVRGTLLNWWRRMLPA